MALSSSFDLRLLAKLITTGIVIVVTENSLKHPAYGLTFLTKFIKFIVFGVVTEDGLQYPEL